MIYRAGERAGRNTLCIPCQSCHRLLRISGPSQDIWSSSGVHTDAILLGVQFLGVYHATHHIARHAANGFEDAPLPCCALESTVAEEVPMFPVRKMNEGGAMQSRTILGRSSAMHAKCLI